MSASSEILPPAQKKTLGRTVLPFVLLALALVCLCTSLLAIFPAPNALFWILAIGATEYGHWFFLGPIALIPLASVQTSFPRTITTLSLISCGLFLSSAFRAIPKATQIQTEVCQAFPVPNLGTQSPNVPWFQLRNLWLGKNAPPIPFETIRFSENTDSPLSLRFYRAVSQSPAPCIVILHTGSWNGGSIEEFQNFNSHFARLGYAIAVIEYRLAPRWIWPAQRDDVVAAITTLQERSTELGIDPARFVLLGRSAGGQIAEAVAYGAHLPGICGVIAFYAPADMTFAFQYARSDDILNSLKLLRDFLGGDPAQQPENYQTASGIGLVQAASPPTLLLHGKRDELVWSRQSDRLALKLAQTGTPHYLLSLGWATHAFDYNPHGPGGQLSTRAIERFLESVTAAPTPTKP